MTVSRGERDLRFLPPCTCDPGAFDMGPEGQRRYFEDRYCPVHGESAERPAAKYQDVPVYEYEDVVIERDRYREALKAIERMAGAAGSGEVPAMPIAELARWALK